MRADPCEPFCHLDTNGRDSNLQLYALEQSTKQWEDLTREIDHDGLSSSRIRERCAFIVACLAMSLVQLLGQNYSSHGTETFPALMRRFLGQAGIDRERRRSLNKRFDDFVETYNGIHHFGPHRHALIASLDYAKTERYVDLTMEVWDLVVEHLRVRQPNQFSGFNCVEEVLEEDRDASMDR
jgi:hypothetical protein